MVHQREHWATRLGFIMAAIGSAIGLGTLWMFPYVTGENGGGLFVLIYLICTVFLGIPVFIAELMLGRKSQRGVVGTFTSLSERGQEWKLVGWLSVIAPLLILSYYQVVAGWGLNYVFLSLSDFTRGRGTEEVQNIFDLLYHSADITLLFMVLFAGIVAAMVHKGVQKGIEHWSRIMTIGLLIILLCLIGFSMTLDGFGAAVKFIFYPDPSKLTASGVLRALGLSFFTLSLGHGVMLTYGSYMKRSDDIPKVAFIVATSDVVISVLAALMIFPIVFTFGFAPDQEAGLIFRTLPVLFARVPATILVSTAFFVLFVFTALTSAIAMLEVAVANMMDMQGFSRNKATLIAAVISVVLGIPCALSGTTFLFPQWQAMYGKTYFETINFLVSAWLLPTIALLTSIFAGWVVSTKVQREEFSTGSVFGWLFGLWQLFVRFIVPVAIILVMLQQTGLINIDKWFAVK
ncbi:MAG: sodium-dependent transporter [Verrucomicrobia bacterium]|nr:sodium-dependent transporter [Verrucomicrobiota bacterium]